MRILFQSWRDYTGNWEKVRYKVTFFHCLMSIWLWCYNKLSKERLKLLMQRRMSMQYWDWQKIFSLFGGYCHLDLQTFLQSDSSSRESSEPWNHNQNLTFIQLVGRERGRVSSALSNEESFDHDLRPNAFMWKKF